MCVRVCARVCQRTTLGVAPHRPSTLCSKTGSRAHLKFTLGFPGRPASPRDQPVSAGPGTDSQTPPCLAFPGRWRLNLGPCPGNTLSRCISPAHPLLQFQLWPPADVAWVAQILPQAAWSLGHLQALVFESMWLKLSVPGKPFSALSIVQEVKRPLPGKAHFREQVFL